MMKSIHSKLILDFMSKEKLSQQEMAQRLEITPATLSRWLSDTQKGHGISKKNKKRIEFVCGSENYAEITEKILDKVKSLPEAKQWKVYDYLVKNF